MRISTLAGVIGTNNNYVAVVASALGTVACLGCGDVREVTDPAVETTSSSITEANTQGTWPGFFEPATNAVTQTWQDIIAETGVTQASAADPTGSNYYVGQTTITISNYTGNSPNYAFLRFVVDHFTGPITQATLKVFVTDGIAAGGAGNGLKVRLAGDAWDMERLDYNHMPGVVTTSTINEILNTAIPTGWLSINVTPAVTGNGVYTFRLATTGMGADDLIIRTLNYWESSAWDLNHQCGGAPCVQLQVTGPRNTPDFNCPGAYSSVSQSGTLPTAPQLDNVSGFTASAKFQDQFYAHNDQSGTNGTKGKIYVIAKTGGTPVATLTPAAQGTASSQLNWTATDPEDIQVGPGPAVKASYVYLGDIGDNGHSRGDIQILRTRETNVNTTLNNGNTEILRLRYPNGWKLNSEAFLIDPVTGNLTVIEKACGTGSGTVLGTNRLFTMKAPLPFGHGEAPADWATNTLSYGGGAITMPADSGGCSTQTMAMSGQRVTGSGVTMRTGGAVAVTFYGQSLFWWIHRHRQLVGTADALATNLSWGTQGSPFGLPSPFGGPYGSKCNLQTQTDASDPKRESISFGWSGGTRDLITSGEGSGHAIWSYQNSIEW